MPLCRAEVLKHQETQEKYWANRHVKCARVIVKKPMQKEVKISLSAYSDDKTLCEFQDIHMEMGNLAINDTKLMDTAVDGNYRLKFEIGENVFYRYIIVS